MLVVILSFTISWAVGACHRTVPAFPVDSLAPRPSLTRKEVQPLAPPLAVPLNSSTPTSAHRQAYPHGLYYNPANCPSPRSPASSPPPCPEHSI